METQQYEAILLALDDIDESDFRDGRGGWPDEISTALVDAVFSIRARYEAATPGKGVLGRVESFRELHPDRRDDLEALVELGEGQLTDIMGATQTGGRPKSHAVMEAAHALRDIGVNRAANLADRDIADVKATYTNVHGLGWITFEYFLMLLGRPGIKADTMVGRFVNSALRAQGLDTVDAKRAHQLLTDIFEKYNRAHWKSLSTLDHAIWRYQRRK